MPLQVKVNIKENSYRIVIGHQILKDIGVELKNLNIGSEALIITHPFLKRLYGPVIQKSLLKQNIGVKFFEVPEGEKSKSAKVFVHLLERIAAHSTSQDVFIIALGGGVIGDLAGFVAAVYRRGVPYVQVPTTLLAQIDSAIGGKTAIDLNVGKNLVGAFHQPALVLSDTAVLSTLSKRQVRNGLAEAVKYGVILDRKLFDYISRNVTPLLMLNPNVLTELVYQCSRIKGRVVEQDEKETRGLRTILNFGHTIGHAIEAAGKFSRYHHGEAVALGMRIAAELSVKLGCLTTREAGVLNEVLSDIGLPEKVQGIAMPAILKHMMHDKKFKGGKTRFVLATSIGSVKVEEGIPLATIKSAIQPFGAGRKR